MGKWIGERRLVQGGWYWRGGWCREDGIGEAVGAEEDGIGEAVGAEEDGIGEAVGAEEDGIGERRLVQRRMV
jgi:hypothetical protein